MNHHSNRLWLSSYIIDRGFKRSSLNFSAFERHKRPSPRKMSEVEDTLKRLQAQKGVQGLIVINNEGIPIRTTMDNSTTVQYAGLLQRMVDQSRNSVRDMDPQDDLTFLRIRSKKHEIMIAPEKDYMLLVIQNPVE